MDYKDVTLKVIIDVIIVLVVGSPVLVFATVVQPFHRGFFCDDESISHPYKSNTISTVVLIVVSLGLTVVGMIVCELVIYRYALKSSQLDGTVTNNIHVCYTMFKRNVHPYIAMLYKSFGAYLMGAAICQCTTDIMKYSIGRLRPHFLAVCKPDWGTFECRDEHGFMRFIEESVCTGDVHQIAEARLSHPSGHASFSFYSLLYLSFYVQSKLTWKGSRLWRHFLQVLLIYMALYCSLSRISDYMHHWSDVLGGAVLGIAVAIVTAVYISDLFKRPPLHLVAQKLNELQNYLGANELRPTTSTNNSNEPQMHQL